MAAKKLQILHSLKIATFFRYNLFTSIKNKTLFLVL